MEATVLWGSCSTPCRSGWTSPWAPPRAATTFETHRSQICLRIWIVKSSGLDHESYPLTDLLRGAWSIARAAHVSTGKQLLSVMLDFEPEQPDVLIGPHADAAARTVMLSPIVIDQIGFDLSVRASHAVTQCDDMETTHELTILATSEDARITTKVLEGVLSGLRAGIQASVRSSGAVGLRELREAIRSCISLGDTTDTASECLCKQEGPGGKHGFKCGSAGHAAVGA